MCGGEVGGEGEVVEVFARADVDVAGGGEEEREEVGVVCAEDGVCAEGGCGESGGG